MERPDPNTIPDTPGVYLYKDGAGQIIYVGKARILKKRVLSYFRKDGLSQKTRAMLAHATQISYISTTTEKEALLLEASLIKKHHPHYNIALRDDKQYFLFRLAVKNDYPRLEIVRNQRQDDARYFGPFTSALAARETWKLLHRTFKIRRCSDRAMNNRVRPCLYYHMQQCSAPCLQLISRDAYHESVEKVAALLDGRAGELLTDLEQAMFKASDALEFELAAQLRDQIKAIKRTIEQQAVILPGKMDTDVMSLFEGQKGMSLAILFVRSGSITESRSFYFKDLSLQDASDLLLSFLAQYYALQLPPPRLLLPFKPADFDSTNEALNQASNQTVDEKISATNLNPTYDDLTDLLAYLQERSGHEVKIDLPKTPQDEQLLDVAQANAKEEVRRKESTQRLDILPRLAKALHLKDVPTRLECVDVSHNQGQDTRVGLVVYVDGKPSPKDYRVYKMDDSADDYLTLHQWVKRRLTSGPPWPNLLLIDGGQGQISAVLKSLEEENSADLFALAGIVKAKNEQGRPDRHKGNVGDHIFIPGRVNPLPLKEGSQELLFLQQVRDATHHLAITKHRQAHSKTALSSDLLSLKGIGAATARLLWDKFGSLEKIKAATLDDLLTIKGFGQTKAQNVLKALQNLDN
ncbi:MAG: excinuclease ABC subunit C [Desulfovibrionaceae bacterium]|nr:excinuclease ABC subunit C [Desulfovibrionaceae bacterium]